MDPSVLLMLSNLLHLHNHLDPLLPDSATAPSSPSASSSSAAPLLFFALASVLSYATSSSSSSSSASPLSGPPPPATGLSSFRRLLSPSSPDSRFLSRYGLSRPLFSALVDKLRPHLRRSASVPALLPPDYAVSIALSRLACGSSLRSVARSHSLAPSVVSKLTNAVTRLVATHLYPEYIQVPAGHRLLQTIQGFRDLTSLPNSCGAIDTSPLRLRRAPEGDDDAYYQCRYGYPAVLLQVVADTRKIFWDVCVKAPGSVDDATHFRDSQLYARFTNLEILRDAVTTVRGHHVRPYVVGDWAFPLLTFLLTPFTPDGTGTPAQNGFDAALMRGRAASVEAAIGLLKGRWRILRDMNVGVEHAAQTAVACCVLHNMCQLAGEPEDERVQDPRESAPPARTVESEKSFYHYGESLRQAMADDLYEKMQRRSSGGRASSLP